MTEPRIQFRLRSGVEIKGFVVPKYKIEEFVAAGTLPYITLTDAQGQVVGTVKNLRMAGVGKVVGDLDLNGVTEPHRVRALMRTVANLKNPPLSDPHRKPELK